MGVAMEKPHPLPGPHVFSNAHSDSLRAHAKFRLFWFQCFDVMPRHLRTNIHAYLRTKIYIKNRFVDLIP